MSTPNVPSPADPVTCPRCRLSFSPNAEAAAEAAPPDDGTVSALPRGAPISVTPTAPTSGDVPARIDRFAITCYLGEGAFGRVYQAEDPLLKRTVALKVAKPEQLVGQKRVERFQREARAAANLLHPHIVAVFDSGRYGAHHYIASAFVPGRSLATVLDETAEAGKKMDLREAVQLVRKLAEALAYAHKQGVVHRDVKPGNVMVREDGEPLLMDFGLAARNDETEKLTVAGQFMGTPEYTAPEQWRGQAQAASDQYSLGCLLFEVLTGEKPFSGGSTEHYLMLHTQVAPESPRKYVPELPRDLETICLKCLEKEPGRRYADCQVLADDLRRWLEDEPVTARRPGMAERLLRWSRRNPALAGLLGVTLLALVVVSVLSGNLAVARNNALAKEQKATKARDFLANIFRISESGVRGGNTTAREILADAERRIPVEFADQEDLQADLLRTISEVKRRIVRTIPQAMLLEVRGSVQLRSAGGKAKTARPQTLVNLDDRLSLAADAQVQLVFLSDLHKERVKPGREVIIDYKGCEPADAVLERDDSVLMTFVRLPKGTFYMGWDGKPGSAKKKEIKEDFEIAVHTVTQGQWHAVMGNNPSLFSRKGNGRNDVLDISDEELKLFPVEDVSWDDAQTFIKKLNEKERGRGYVYRLPTEAEWEYACRGGATSEAECSYHFYFARPTNDLSSEQANFNGSHPDGEAPKREYLKRTTRVGAYPPNKLGLCDMQGNVWQWCADPIPQGGSDRAFRGSCWGVSGQECRAAYRGRSAPSTLSGCLGFRLARVPVR
jgi:formylglycine-generating enzyme required for sulfatase activity/tRNA A-37 threonylcarbamoyl transferase component Bud32